jgi:hypothetical protein
MTPGPRRGRPRFARNGAATDPAGECRLGRTRPQSHQRSVRTSLDDAVRPGIPVPDGVRVADHPLGQPRVDTSVGAVGFGAHAASRARNHATVASASAVGDRPLSVIPPAGEHRRRPRGLARRCRHLRNFGLRPPATRAASKSTRNMSRARPSEESHATINHGVPSSSSWLNHRIGKRREQHLQELALLRRPRYLRRVSDDPRALPRLGTPQCRVRR